MSFFCILLLVIYIYVSCSGSITSVGTSLRGVVVKPLAF